jgi:hypothetical protein
VVGFRSSLMSLLTRWAPVLGLLCVFLVLLPEPQFLSTLATAGEGRTPAPWGDDDQDEAELKAIDGTIALRRELMPRATGVFISTSPSASRRPVLRMPGVPFERARLNGVGAPLLC